jgi:hypothetical protein
LRGACFGGGVLEPKPSHHTYFFSHFIGAK